MCPLRCSTSVYHYFPKRYSVWSVIKFFLLYSNVSCTFNPKKERKTAATCNLLTKGRLFYLCVLLSASEMSHTSENWHCDFQFVREAGWFHVPTETGCLLLSFMKYKSQIRAWCLSYSRARAESPPLVPAQQDRRTQASMRPQNPCTHEKSTSCLFPSPVRCAAERQRVPLPASRPELPSGLRVCIDEPVQRAALMTQLITTWHGAIVHITDN